MRRIAFALLLVAAVVGIHACAADAPTAPKPGGAGGGQSSAISVQLFTSDANPKAGTCTLVEAIVTLNGASVPDGTAVNFSTDFGTFGENGLPLVSIVTTNGTAVAALCGPGPGTAKVKGTVSIAGKTNSGTVNVTFQGEGALPFVTFCSPSFGPKEGGTSVTLNGGRFFGSPSTTRVTFTVNGVSKDGLVTAVTANTVTVTTPGFPEVAAPSALAPITLTLGTNQPQPVVLSLPTCFSYGTQDSGTPNVTAILPASGAKAGNTRVTIVGSGFASSGVQVFFGTVEATVVSVSFNQVIALSPPAPFGEVDFTAPVTVKNINSGVVSNAVLFSYTPDMHITAIANGSQSTDKPFTPVTIYGTGFQAPVVVTLANIQAFVQSVSATELVVLPGTPAGCGGGGSGAVIVTNITTGETATNSGVVFTYIAVPMTVVSLVPPAGLSGASVEIDGSNLPTSIANTQVHFGARAAMVNAVSATAITVTAPPGTVTTPPTCTGSNPAGTLQTVETVPVSVQNLQNGCLVTGPPFGYQLPCVVPGP